MGVAVREWTGENAKTRRGEDAKKPVMIRSNPGNWLLVAIAVGVAGCGTSSGTSSAPASGSAASASTPRDLATQSATAVVLMKNWTQLLYGLQDASAPATATPSCTLTVGQPQVQPDGSRVTEITFSNCVHETLTEFRDGHRKGIITPPPPDTRVIIQTDTPQVKTGNIITQSVSREYPVTGDSVAYTITYDTKGTLRMRDDVVKDDGKITFKSQPAADFHIVQMFTATAVDTLTMTASDGSQFSLNVPTNATEIPRTIRFDAMTKGTYTSGGKALQFALTAPGADATTWNHLTLSTPDGETGAFLINPDFSGRGQFSHNGQVDFALSFAADGATTVTAVGGRDATITGPSAAALAFLLHIWRQLSALQAPSPGG